MISNFQRNLWKGEKYQRKGETYYEAGNAFGKDESYSRCEFWY